ncbi:MAG: alpha/beta hydrolase-fold protein [Saprospiraceae bacterium]
MKSTNHPSYPPEAWSGTPVEVLLEVRQDDERPIKMVGNFNDWNLDYGFISFQKISPGKYRGFLPPFFRDHGEMIYKYTKGDWDDLEADEYGTLSFERKVDLKKVGKTIEDKVSRWLSDGKGYDEALLPIIKILPDDLGMPSLIKTRRIAALLPHDYETSGKHYPVLYLQDGQNLFDDYAPFGNWAVDKKLAVLAEKLQHEVIVVAIDHAKEQRISEFTPSHNTKLGIGDGKKYARFLADNLKPYIDKNFRTKPERRFTGIGGSSMGGLISLYAAWLYPEVYSKLMIMSPSLWVDPDLISKSGFINDKTPFKLYLYAGMQEGASLISLTDRLEKAILERTKTGWQAEVKKCIEPLGKHNENDWGRAFPKALKWLYFEK